MNSKDKSDLRLLLQAFAIGAVIIVICAAVIAGLVYLAIH